MSATRESNDNVTVPSVDEQIFIARYFSGAVCLAEIAQWLRRSSFVRQELAEFIEVIEDLLPEDQTIGH